MNWIYLLFCYLFLNGIVLFFIGIFRIKKNPATRYYFFQYLVLLLLVTEFVFIWYMYEWAPFFCYPDFPIRFLLTPFIFLYVCTYTNPAYKPSTKTLLLLFTPAVIELICFIVISIYYYQHPYSAKERRVIANNSDYYIIRTSAALLYNVICISVAYSKIKIFSWNILKVLSNLRKLNLLWLKTILAVSVFLWLFWGFVFVTEMIFSLTVAVTYMYFTLYILVGIVVLAFGYFSVLKPYVPEAYVQVNEEIKVITEKISNEQKAGFVEAIQINDKTNDKEELAFYKQYFQALEKNIINNQSFKDPDLTMGKIANNLGTTSFNISKAIKIHSKEGSFYEFINRHRLIHFLHLLSNQENNQFTINTLALKSGFTSASTLNKYCRKITGTTPATAKSLLETGKTVHDLMLN